MNTKRLIIIAGIVIPVLLAAWGAFRILQAKGFSDVTVTAALHSVDDRGFTVRRQVRPRAAAGVVFGNGRETRSAAFNESVLRIEFDHGPVEINGVISAGDIRDACPQAAVTEDWPFSILFYNTSSGRVFHIYLDIGYHVPEGTAQADLYIFEDHSAMATQAHWEGQPGEPIRISPDGMDI